MYAIVRTGGKQYRVEEGRALTIERLPAEEGATVELSEVLLIADDGQVTVGAPLIEGARVMAHVDAHGRRPKIVVFKYKAKVRARTKTGHRQPFTKLTVTEILRPGQESKEALPRKGPRRRVAEAEAPAEEAVEAPAAEAVAPPPELPVKAPPRRVRRAPAPAKAAAPLRPPRRAPAKAAKPVAAKKAPVRKARPKAADAARPKAKTGRRILRRKKETE